MIKELFVDVETTGTDVNACGIWQVAGLVRYPGVAEEFNFRCDIFEDDVIESSALSKIKEKDLKTFDDPYETHRNLCSLLGKHVDKYNPQDKFFFIGYGAEFDYKMLRRWFAGMGDQYFGSWIFMPWIDVMVLAAQAMRPIRPRMANFKLETVLEWAGINFEPDKLHDALYDIQKTIELYDRINTGQEFAGVDVQTRKRGRGLAQVRLKENEAGKKVYRMGSDETELNEIRRRRE